MKYCYFEQYVISKQSSSNSRIVVLKDDGRKVRIGDFATAIDSGTKKEPDLFYGASRELMFGKVLRGQVLMIKHCRSRISNIM